MATSPPYPPRSPRYGGPGAPRPEGRRRPGRAVRVAVVAGLLAVCGLLALATVRERTGSGGFLVGLGLAALPVGPLLAVFWLLGGRARPASRLLVFSLAWGACAAALIAMAGNSFGARALDAVDASGMAGTALVAPVVEECAKAGALVLLLRFRRGELGGALGGVVVAGVTATGFAFTENVLYLGDAYGSDRLTGERWLHSLTLATFLVRVGMGLFAHPLFSVITALGVAAGVRTGTRRRGRGRSARVLLSCAGLLTAVGLHALWNSSPRLGGFPLVYGAAMVPVFLLTAGCCLWLRRRGAGGAGSPADPAAPADPTLPALPAVLPAVLQGPVFTAPRTGGRSGRSAAGGTGPALRGGGVQHGQVLGGEGDFGAGEQRRELRQ